MFPKRTILFTVDNFPIREGDTVHYKFANDHATYVGSGRAIVFIGNSSVGLVDSKGERIGIPYSSIISPAERLQSILDRLSKI